MVICGRTILTSGHQHRFVVFFLCSGRIHIGGRCEETSFHSAPPSLPPPPPPRAGERRWGLRGGVLRGVRRQRAGGGPRPAAAVGAAPAAPDQEWMGGVRARGFLKPGLTLLPAWLWTPQGVRRNNYNNKAGWERKISRHKSAKIFGERSFGSKRRPKMAYFFLGFFGVSTPNFG